MKQISLKFCGFQTIEHVRIAATLPIDAIGFILVSGRRRTVSLQKVKEMISYIPSHIASVGVLQNPSLQDVEDMEETGLSMIQLHGTESTEFCQQIKERFELPIIKVFTVDQISNIISYQSVIDLVLLDHSKGGVGTPIDWGIIPQASELKKQIGVPLWIAGGLNETNIDMLCSQYEIDGIDISSGIEVNGVKDEAKMRAMIERMTKIWKRS